jgi:hypothetical protein
MRKVIFVTTIKPFNEFFKFRQLNAIQSWLLLKDIDKKILILTEDDIEEDLEKLFNYNDKVQVIKNFEKSPSTNIPTFRALYSAAKDEIKSDKDIICQINADMILLDDFSKTINNILDQINSKNFCFIGQRTSWKEPNSIDFSNENWSNILFNQLKNSGELNPACAIDYFICSEKTFEKIPEFYIARMKYDNWLVSNAIKNNEYTIDVTKTIFSIHQDHWYGNNGNLDFNSWLPTVNDDFRKNSQLSNDFADISQCKIFSELVDNTVVMKYK